MQTELYTVILAVNVYKIMKHSQASQEFRLLSNALRHIFLTLHIFN